MGQLDYTTEDTNRLLAKIDGFPESVEDGKTPRFSIGTVSTLPPGENATASLTEKADDPSGNPVYLLNLGIPEGQAGSGGGTQGSVSWSDIQDKPSWVNSSTKPNYTASEVGALPAATVIPSKTSQLSNDSGFTTESSFKTINGESIIGDGDISVTSGGGTSGGGNVNVTNKSSLSASKHYAFKPSSDGSLTGEMSLVPNATSAADGLMPHAMFSKLDRIKEVLAFPAEVLDLTPESASGEIAGLFEGLELPLESIIIYYALALKADYDASIPLKVFIGNVEAFVSGGDLNMDGSDVASASLYVSYIDKGVLSTIILSFVMEGSSPVFSFKKESASQEYYYLDPMIKEAKNTWTKDDLTEAFGSSEKVLEFITEVFSNGRKPYILQVTDNLIAGKATGIPVTAEFTGVLGVYFILSFDTVGDIFNYNGTIIHKIIKGVGSISTPLLQATVSEIHLPGYKANILLYEITGESSSEDISKAVGGETGLLSMINAAKDGNNIIISGTPGLMESSGASVCVILDTMAITTSDNGDMNIALSGTGMYMWGGMGGVMSISYVKSTGVFSASIKSGLNMLGLPLPGDSVSDK